MHAVPTLDRAPVLATWSARAVSLLTTLLALGAGLLVAPAFNDAPVPLFLAAVIVSAWSGGFGAGMQATLLGSVALGLCFDLSRDSPLLRSLDTLFDLSLFVAVALLMTGLIGRLHTLNKRVEDARAEAQSAVRVREEVLGIVAHDLRSPLTGISVSAQLAERLLRPLESVQRQPISDRLGEVQADVTRMVGLLDDLVDVAHLGANQPLRLRTGQVRLAAVVAESLKRHEANVETHSARLVLEADPVGEWDACRVKRVLDNLLSNATKYSPPGSEVTLTVREEHSGTGERWAVVSVRDQGIGIPSGDLPRLFNRFFRAGNVGDRPGTGLGLAGAHQIAVQHGGCLSVESQEGLGTTFFLRLPL